jgi:hypothetical protein
MHKYQGTDRNETIDRKLWASTALNVSITTRDSMKFAFPADR